MSDLRVAFAMAEGEDDDALQLQLLYSRDVYITYDIGYSYGYRIVLCLCGDFGVCAVRCDDRWLHMTTLCTLNN